MTSDIEKYVFENEGTEPTVQTCDVENSNQSIENFVFGTELDVAGKLIIPYPSALDVDRYLKVLAAGQVSWDILEASTYWGNILGTLSEQEDLQAALDTKVDKVTGYGLSQNDLTDALKATYDGYASTIAGKENTGVAAGLLSTHESTYTHSDIALNTSARHSHSNKSTLDLIDVAFTTALKTNYDTAYTNSHTHSNKATLDLISSAFTTTLKSTYDGYASTIAGKEPALGNPSVTGYILSSTDAGVRSWIAQSAGVTAHASLTQLDYASAGHIGFEPTVTKGNLTELTSSILTIGSGTGAVIGSGTTITVQQADASHAGYLSSTDWNTFNNKSSFSGSYNDLSDKPSIPTALSELSDDSTHRLVTDTEKSTWNGKQDALGYTPVPNTRTVNSKQLNSDISLTYSDVGAQVAGSYQTASDNLTSLTALSYSATAFVKMTSENTFALDTNTYLTSLSGAVLTDQSTPQTIGATGTRLAKLWATDITCTNAIAADITGNAATATSVTKSTNLVGGNSTTLLGSLPYQSDTDTTTLLSPNTTTTKKYLTMTGNGTNGAAPAWEDLSSKLDTTVQINAQTGTSYSLQASDNGKLITLNNASAITLTVPASLVAGFNCQILQIGAGQVTVSPSSTIVNNANSHTKLRSQYSSASLVAYASDTFLFQGDTAP